jgi:hypothetical protein
MHCTRVVCRTYPELNWTKDEYKIDTLYRIPPLNFHWFCKYHVYTVTNLFIANNRRIRFVFSFPPFCCGREERSSKGVLVADGVADDCISWGVIGTI